MSDPLRGRYLPSRQLTGFVAVPAAPGTECVGVETELEVLAELSGGAYLLPDIGPVDLARLVEVLGKYRDQGDRSR